MKHILDKKSHYYTNNRIDFKYLKTYEEFFWSEEEEETDIKIGDTSWLDDKSVSEQVRNQIKYLMKFGPVKKFTVLDDINNILYAINKDFSLNFKCEAMTGKEKGDEMKTITFQDWVKNKFGKFEIFKSSIISYFKYGRVQTSDTDLSKGAKLTDMDKLVSQYFEEIFKVKSTPSGVFKRAERLTDWFNNLLLTLTDKETYGRNYITWNTFWSDRKDVERGKQIPIGFHGTEDSKRIENSVQTKIDGLKEKTQKFKTQLDFSFGCVNFKDQDLIKVNEFIDYGDLSFWLPDANTNILEIDEASWKNS
jgi:hypothetical protein